MIIKQRLVLFVALLFAIQGAAQAALVTYTFSGNVTNISGTLGSDLAGVVSVGDSFEFTYTWDTSISDSYDTTPDHGLYPDAVTNVSGTFGSAGPVASYLPGGIETWDRLPSDTGPDEVRLRGNYNDTFGSYKLLNSTVDLLDSTGNAFTSDAMPSSINLADFDTRKFFLSFHQNSFPYRNDQVEGEITSAVAVSTVPLPPALYLFFSGLLTLAGIRRKSRSS